MVYIRDPNLGWFIAYLANVFLTKLQGQILQCKILTSILKPDTQGHFLQSVHQTPQNIERRCDWPKYYIFSNITSISLIESRLGMQLIEFEHFLYAKSIINWVIQLFYNNIGI